MKKYSHRYIISTQMVISIFLGSFVACSIHSVIFLFCDLWVKVFFYNFLKLESCLCFQCDARDNLPRAPGSGLIMMMVTSTWPGCEHWTRLRAGNFHTGDHHYPRAGQTAINRKSYLVVRPRIMILNLHLVQICWVAKKNWRIGVWNFNLHIEFILCSA